MRDPLARQGRISDLESCGNQAADTLAERGGNHFQLDLNGHYKVQRLDKNTSLLQGRLVNAQIEHRKVKEDRPSEPQPPPEPPPAPECPKRTPLQALSDRGHSLINLDYDKQSVVRCSSCGRRTGAKTWARWASEA